MVALAMLAAYWLLRADLLRRGLSSQIDAETLVAIPCLAGIVGAKLYHVLETPTDLLANPFGLLFSQFGFAWFGGLLTGLAAFLWLGRSHRIPLLLLLDVGSPAAALGYGIGRIGCLLSGDGDYGIPTSLPWCMRFPNGLVPTNQCVHPTPIYELIAACFTAWWLWRMGNGAPVASSAARVSVSRGQSNISKGAQQNLARRPGQVFAAYLLISGTTRFLVEFIRINPRSFLGLTNAQLASLACVVGGLILWLRLRES